MTDFWCALKFIDKGGSATVFWDIVLAFPIHYFKYTMLKICGNGGKNVELFLSLWTFWSDNFTNWRNKRCVLVRTCINACVLQITYLSFDACPDFTTKSYSEWIMVRWIKKFWLVSNTSTLQITMPLCPMGLWSLCWEALSQLHGSVDMGFCR